MIIVIFLACNCITFLYTFTEDSVSALQNCVLNYMHYCTVIIIIIERTNVVYSQQQNDKVITSYYLLHLHVGLYIDLYF